jgi:hypothetical protein
MIILGLLLEVMDLSGADLDNVTRPRLPANAAVDDRQRSILHLPHAAELLRYQRHAGRAQHSLYGAALSFTRTHFRASVVTYDDPIFSPREIDNTLGLKTRSGEMLAVLVPWLIVELRPLPVVSSSMKVEVYCFTPPESTLCYLPETATHWKHRQDRNLRLDISWKLPLLSSVDRGNLGLHKGRHLVEFA